MIEPCTIAHCSLDIPCDRSVLSNPRCAGGRGHLPEQADQRGSRPEPVCELPSAPATPAGLQNSALPAQVSQKHKRTVRHYHLDIVWNGLCTNIKIDLIDGCCKTEEEMEKRGLAAFKTNILIKNRTEIWLCYLLVCQVCNPAKICTKESWDINVPFPRALMHQRVLHLELLNFPTIKKHTSH